VAIDTANGMGGSSPAVLERLPVTLHHLFPELDGTFPNHPADPIDPENQRDLRAAVLPGTRRTSAPRLTATRRSRS
jgi:phosphomannomutase